MHRRTLDTTALYHLSRIISSPSERSEAIMELISLGDDAKAVLRMEAECRVPDEVKDIWNSEGDVWEEDDYEVEGEVDERSVREDWIERRWWAKQALGCVPSILNIKLV